MSGVFSMAAHWVLQYLPDVITHEQIGCAHFWPFAVAISFILSAVSISFLLAAGQRWLIQRNILNTWGQAHLSNKEHSRRIMKQ